LSVLRYGTENKNIFLLRRVRLGLKFEKFPVVLNGGEKRVYAGAAIGSGAKE